MRRDAATGRFQVYLVTLFVNVDDSPAASCEDQEQA